ncbi:PaaX domain-containing protein, C- domain protein [Nocardioides sp. TRM66260-LWL]|uniref:PaaX family transcriptional regulator C-terminal domain-containing protein n=1 Tax=Nocardioides sp. TRM66260-LWL TaxID=2874478 RepID=UPI001CC53F75|nr:PaaX family transcriptional regulator C-terminal domain-containing protein [Nocardioides sp. TRM66260-LWL]MBZ5735291.1 PaaX domain-containing protein, C- domain protein [Nocardioides sp. TRM66260-LWL]
MADPHAPTAGTRPLSVRSGVVSVLLGCHPESLSSRRIVAIGRHLGMGESAVRAALTRGVAAGDLERTPDGYRIGPRQLERHRQQSEAVAPGPAAWDGTWETAVVVAAARPPAERTALRALLLGHRLAELREGVWLRPANLGRPAGYRTHPDVHPCTSTHDHPAELARRLWDLDAWASTARRLVDDLASGRDAAPAERLAAAALLVRHLRTDPILPPALLPDEWPGALVRAAYAGYQAELRELAAGL